MIHPSLTMFHPSLTMFHPSLTTFHPSLTTFHPPLFMYIRFYDFVNDAVGDGAKGLQILSMNSSDGDTFQIEYEYELSEKGERVVLGRGSFGTVYSGFDLDTNKKMAIKEVKLHAGESDSG